jgi:hypothetical protein
LGAFAWLVARGLAVFELLESRAAPHGFPSRRRPNALM